MRARLALLAAGLLALAAPAMAETRWSIIATYPHDSKAFTEGLFYHDGQLWESTGLVGQSDIRVSRLSDGRVLRRVKVPPPYFGEGIVAWRDRLISLTWSQGKGFIWSWPKLKQIGSFAYSGEGWGLTADERTIYMSDGTADIRRLDPETLKEQGRIHVTWQGRPVRMLNELEYVDGEILANVWTTPYIVRIDPASGAVIDWIDLRDLVEKNATGDTDAVLNGIAWDKTGRRLFVTGKNWANLYQIRLEK